MQILNDLSQIKNLDKENMIDSIRMLTQQVDQVREDFKKIKFSKWDKIKNIIVSGMGGSALGAHIIKSLYADKLNLPLEIVNDYHLPSWAGKNTLCIISTYSGTTEETLNTLNEAIEKKCLIIGITSGKNLKKYFDEKKINAYFYDERFNPCQSPRMGLGYSIFGQIYIFKKLGLIDFSEKEIDKILDEIKENMEIYGDKNNFSALKLESKKEAGSFYNINKAKQMAGNLMGSIPIIVSSEFLLGSAHIFANQINENAKTFATYFSLPEINHHLMEGLMFPLENKNILKFLFVKSNLYSQKNLLRYNVTQKVLEKNFISYIEYETKGDSKLSQIMDVLVFGSWVSFYLGMLNNVDPTPIPNVDFLKSEMAKEIGC